MRPLWIASVFGLTAALASGCGLFDPPQLLELDPQEIYFEEHPDTLRVRIENLKEQPIEVLSVVCRAGEEFYRKEKLGSLEPGGEWEFEIPFTPHHMDGRQVTAQVVYTTAGGARLTADATASIEIDLLDFSFEDARRWAGFMPPRYVYLTWSRTWLFESEAGKSVLLNGVNGHTFQGRWRALGARVDRSEGEPVELAFPATVPDLAGRLAEGGFDARQERDVLRVSLPPDRFIDFVRAVKKYGFYLAAGREDGTLVRDVPRPGGTEAASEP